MFFCNTSSSTCLHSRLDGCVHTLHTTSTHDKKSIGQVSLNTTTTPHVGPVRINVTLQMEQPTSVSVQATTENYDLLESSDSYFNETNMLSSASTNKTNTKVYIFCAIGAIIAITIIILCAVFIARRNHSTDTSNTSGRNLLGETTSEIPDSTLMVTSRDNQESTELDIGSQISSNSQDLTSLTNVTPLSNLSSFKPTANSTMIDEPSTDYVDNSHFSSSAETTV